MICLQLKKQKSVSGKKPQLKINVFENSGKIAEELELHEPIAIISKCIITCTASVVNY